MKVAYPFVWQVLVIKKLMIKLIKEYNRIHNRMSAKFRSNKICLDTGK